MIFRPPLMRPTLFAPAESEPFTGQIKGKGKLSAFAPVHVFYTYNCLLNSDGKYYFVGMGRTENNRDPFVFKYDPILNVIEQETRVIAGTVGWDNHRVASMAHDATGHIYLAFEILKAPPDSHGTDIQIWKTTTPYDISTLAFLNFIDGRYSYSLIVVNGSNVHVSMRGTTSTVTFIRGQYWYAKSSNAGVTFGAPVRLFHAGTEDLPVYTHTIHDYTGTNIYKVWNERSNITSTETFICIFKGSHGSDVWTNLSGSFSRNCASVGHITRAEALANGLVIESADYATKNVFFEGGCVKSDGKICILVSLATVTGEVYIGNSEVVLDELRFYTYSGGVWSYNNVDIPAGLTFFWSYQRYFQYMNNNETFDDIIFINPDANHDVYVFRSTDNFATQTDTLVLSGNGYYSLGAMTHNAETEEEYTIVLNDPPLGADIFEIQFEGPEDYSNLFLFKPIIP